MSIVEDVRKALQDTLAPDLKALAVKVEELEKRMNLRFDAVDARLQGFERRLDDQHAYSEKRFESEREYLDKRFDGLERMLSQQQLINSLVERVRLLESGATLQKPPQEGSRHAASEIERAG